MSRCEPGTHRSFACTEEHSACTLIFDVCRIKRTPTRRLSAAHHSELHGSSSIGHGVGGGEMFQDPARERIQSRPIPEVGRQLLCLYLVPAKSSSRPS